MNLFNSLLSYMATDYKAIVEAKGRAISEKAFDDPRYQDMIQFIYEYAQTHKAAPGLELIEGKFGIVMERAREVSFDVLLYEVLETQAMGIANKQIGLVNAALHNGRAQGLREMLRETLREMDNVIGKKEETTTYGRLLKKVAEKHKKVKHGKRGVPLPWPTLDELTYGLWPDDIMIFAARTGVGKSWVLLMCVMHAWKKGYRVLVLTTEMGQLKLAERMAAIDMKFSPRALRKGKLTDAEMERLDQRIEELADDPNLIVAGGKLLFSVEVLRKLIEETNPQLIVIDGAYMLRTGAKGSNKSRAEKTADALEELKAVQLDVEIPMILSTQFNKNAKKGDEESSEDVNIAQSDVTNWISSYTYALVQSKEDKDKKQMKFKDMKARDDESIAFQSQWDLDTMQFGEIVGPGATGGPSAEPQPVPPPVYQEDGFSIF